MDKIYSFSTGNLDGANVGEDRVCEVETEEPDLELLESGLGEHVGIQSSNDQTHLLRSARNISHAKKSTLEAMVNAGISVASVVSYMENEAHGPKNLGFIRKDAYDHFEKLKKHTKIENGDATALLQHFIRKANKESFFYWNAQLNDDDRVMNFFFRDYRCVVDYEYFGDVLSIDTTYRTNKYNLICAPFIGINHHRNNVLFGLAFMSDETQSSFEWFFATFLDSMNGKQPQIIFSDQCQAMMNAIENVFPNSHHRLCQWHINQNAPSHFGDLNGNSSFKDLWYKCMSHCESEEEFENTWKFMVDSYHLHDRKWFNGMYKLRRKWATTFNNELFSAGLLATSRSQNANKVLKHAGSKSSSLYEFVINYEKVQNQWRTKEKVEDTRCRHGKPSQILKNHPLLDHAASVYTLTIYGLFEHELVGSLNCKVDGQPFSIGNDGTSLEFRVKSNGDSSRIRHVSMNTQTNETRCSCHKFETMGILCKHILVVFNYMDVTMIPDAYLLKRWMKCARLRVSNDFKASDVSCGTGEESDLVFVNKAMRTAYNLAHMSKTHLEA
ncbi:Protein FAR1-RELATED SEQUENCE 5 [Striga hermonthica]|uniref:Protein FAR1-RELATED SEQUENCE 5 n=1 Tax=Striga hermonthica TaxID=68872 RepID=A0A9N7R4L1_STRHE|nr:Protein FAR1-RELATED SEQUENCE 5 [Striga hermonthica]